jgi:hypothetical protein
MAEAMQIISRPARHGASGAGMSDHHESSTFSALAGDVLIPRPTPLPICRPKVFMTATRNRRYWGRAAGHLRSPNAVEFQQHRDRL